MAPQWAVSSLLLLLMGTALAEAGRVGKCKEEDLVITQRPVSKGKWNVEVRSRCEACEATVVELHCPGWVEGKAIEGYMYPVELVAPDLCLLGTPITAHQPFTATYHQPTAKINFTVASARFSCPASSP